MSTKIYDAYRLRDGCDLWPMLWAIKQRGTDHVKANLAQFYADVLSNPNDLARVKRFLIEQRRRPDRPITPHDVAEYVLYFYQAQAASLTRSPFALDVQVSVREYAGRFYLQAYCDWGCLVAGALDFLASVPELEDYYYQTSTDRPAEIGEDEWRERGQTWRTIYENVGQFVALEVLSVSNFWHVEPSHSPAMRQHWTARLASEDA